MKKYLKQIIATVTLLFSGLCLAGDSYYRVVGVAEGDTLSIRQAPSASSKRTGRLYSYDTGFTIGRCKRNGSSTWCEIDFLPDDVMFFVRDFPNNGGWVNEKYIHKASDILYTQAFQYRSNHHIFRVTGVKSNDTLNVRAHPRNSAKKIGELRYNDTGIIATKCQRVGRSSWCYVGYDYTMAWATGPGSTKVPYALLGWVNMRYLKLDDIQKKHRLPGMTFPGEAY